MSLVADIALTRGGFDLDVSIRVEEGETLAILGPNGAGKSTILRAIAGLSPLRSGRIVVDGVTIEDPSLNVFVEPEIRGLGIVFQHHLLFDHMSVLDNVAFGLRATGVPSADARNTAMEWLNRVGLHDHATERPARLSGGQAQRVALARALAVSPRLLLLDEPLSSLDVTTRATLRRELRGHLAGCSGMRILITHDPVDAHALADRIAIVESGRIVQSGTLAEITSHPRSRYVADLVGVDITSMKAADMEEKRA